MHKKGNISLRIVAISASERRPDDTYPRHFDEFKQRLSAVGLEQVEILNTLFHLGMSYLGYCVLAGGRLSDLERKIQEVLFPSIEIEFSDYCRNRGLDLNNEDAWKNWSNKKCDVLALWSHIWYNGEIFFTRDNDFHRKTVKPRLIALGAGEILKPKEAVAKLRK